MNKIHLWKHKQKGIEAHYVSTCNISMINRYSKYITHHINNTTCKQCIKLTK